MVARNVGSMLAVLLSAGASVSGRHPIPGTDDEIVLLDPEQRPGGVLDWHPFENVLRVAPDGVVRWRGELVKEETTVKAYLGLRSVGRLVVAWTWSWNVELDLATGSIVGRRFTK